MLMIPSSSDEEEDIDAMRDDLQSTKSQLGEVLKNRRKLETENKILKIDIDSLQAEVKMFKLSYLLFHINIFLDEKNEKAIEGSRNNRS